MEHTGQILLLIAMSWPRGREAKMNSYSMVIARMAITPKLSYDRSKHKSLAEAVSELMSVPLRFHRKRRFQLAVIELMSVPLRFHRKRVLEPRV